VPGLFLSANSVGFAYRQPTNKAVGDNLWLLRSQRVADVYPIPVDGQADRPRGQSWTLRAIISHDRNNGKADAPVG